MTNDQITQLVKKIEPYFIGYYAHDNKLKNTNGMELVFRTDWKNRTTVSGLHAKKIHSIGCSFEKPVEKIFKDIRRRLISEYHADFFENKREKIERAETQEQEKLQLKALASVVGGEICKNYGQRYSGNSDYVSASNVSIYQTYNRRFEFHLELTYFDAMRLAKILKESSVIGPTNVEEAPAE